MTYTAGDVGTAAQRRLRIALAEDDDEQRELLAEALTDLGFEVLSFEDGFEMLDYLELADSHLGWPDAVISDVNMPGRTGIQALEEARRRGMSAPIVLITGSAPPDVAGQVGKLGGALLFHKPLDVDRLAKAVAAVAEAHGTDPGDAPSH